MDEFNFFNFKSKQIYQKESQKVWDFVFGFFLPIIFFYTISILIYDFNSDLAENLQILWIVLSGIVSYFLWANRKYFAIGILTQFFLNIVFWLLTILFLEMGGLSIG